MVGVILNEHCYSLNPRLQSNNICQNPVSFDHPYCSIKTPPASFNANDNHSSSKPKTTKSERSKRSKLKKDKKKFNALKKNGNVQRKRQTKVNFQKSRKNREILKSTKSNDVQTSFKECKVKKSVKKQHALFDLRTYTGTYNTVTI